MNHPAPHTGHGADEPCTAGKELYERALHDGQVPSVGAADLPCPGGFAQLRAVAALLVEGHTDAATAERPGMNIRTARLHIAGLAAGLGSDSRARLGCLIARSGILDQQP